MTSMIDPGLLVAQEFQLAQEETLSSKRSSFSWSYFVPSAGVVSAEVMGAPGYGLWSLESHSCIICVTSSSPLNTMSAVHRWPLRPRPGPPCLIICGEDKAGISPPGPHLMSCERGGCQVGDWHPVKYDAEPLTDMDRQGDVAQDWEHGLMDWCR